MITLRTLLAGLAACLPRDEAEAVRSVARVEANTRMPKLVPELVPEPRALRDPLDEVREEATC